MTVTQRRVRVDQGKPDTGALVTEPGIKYTCDFCHIDITHTVRIKCAAKECEEVDICPTCFTEGKEGQRHKAWHDYKVVEQHSQPIFSSDWGADEELLLISGLIMNGLGNWAEAAEHVGTRTKEECERHYLETYLVDEPEGEKPIEVDGEENPRKRRREFMPPMDKTFDIDPDEFQARKKARIEEMRKPHALPAPASLAPLVSAPTNHEVAGFMPGRLEFEHEVENEAEMAVKDMEFGLVFKYGGDEQPQAVVTQTAGEEEEDTEEKGAEEEDEDGEGGGGVVKVKEEQVDVKMEPIDAPKASGSRSPRSSSPPADDEKKKKGKGKAKAEPTVVIEDEDELEIKLAMMEIYFSKLDKREEAKELIFDRGLTEHKKIVAMDRKKQKDEKELIQRYKVFAKLQTAQDFEILTEGLIYEQNLRKRITELQEYRRMGITAGPEAEAYDNAKAQRAGYRPMLPRERVDSVPLPMGDRSTHGRINAGQHRFLHGTPPPSNFASREPTPRIPGHGGRKPPTPLNLANAQSLDLLSTEEQSLCSTLRVLPKPYLTIKEMYIRENERRNGLLKRRDARKMMKIDVNKSGRIFDFLVSSGMLSLSYDPSVKGLGPGKEGHVVQVTNGNGMGMTHEIYGM
ncbi:transcriptional adapter 2-alpha, partial [Tremellales sp. Uapishka_1]